MVAPRAFACSSDSNKRTPAPSPMTKPERSLSKGRDACDVTPWEAVLNDAFQHPCSFGSILLACCGLSFPFEHIAFIAENPAYDNGVNGASAPPLSIISASPFCRRCVWGVGDGGGTCEDIIIVNHHYHTSMFQHILIGDRLQKTERFANGMRAGGAGRVDAEVRALSSVSKQKVVVTMHIIWCASWSFILYLCAYLNRGDTRGGVRKECWDGKWGHFLPSVQIQHLQTTGSES